MSPVPHGRGVSGFCMAWCLCFSRCEFVFLVGGGGFSLRVDPPFFLWMFLLLCSDVEENPSPLRGECGGRCNVRCPKCERYDCWVHLKSSGMSRVEFYDIENIRTLSWFCGGCEVTAASRPSVVTTAVPVDGASGPEMCGGCDVKFHIGQCGVRCAVCSLKVHKKCCSLS